MRQLGTLRFVVAAGLIALTAILLEGRGRTELIPPRLSLSSFPAQLGEWRGQDIPLDKETLDVLGAGDFLVRNYRAQDPRLPNVDFFLASAPEIPSTLPRIVYPAPAGLPRKMIALQFR